MLAVIFAALTAANFAGSAQAQSIKEGKWAMTMVTKMAGMDEEMAGAMADMSEEEKAMMQQMMGGMGVSMGPEGMTSTITRCLTNAEPVPEEDPGCKSAHSVKGNTVHFTSTCPDSQAKGEITYHNDSMNGVIHSQSAEGEATIQISGKYVGPCE